MATPLEWSELRRREINARHWTLASIPRRLGQRDDPWHDLARRARSLGDAREALDELRD